MQLVVIAGGLGTRLRPLTLTRPKALVPLLNRPQIMQFLDRLPPSIDHVLIAVNYRYEQVRSFFATNDIGRKVTVVHEPKPLGTGGAIKNIEGHIGGTFAAVNGDMVDALDLTGLMKFHLAHEAIGTLAVAPVEDPSSFGVVTVRGIHATGFVEKPAFGQALSNLANVGRYVFEPEVFDFIDAGHVVSLERDVFPRLVKEGLCVYRYEGMWSDAGTLPSYIRAQSLLLHAGGAAIAESAETARAELLPPNLIAKSCFVEGRVGPNVALGPGCRVGRAVVRDSALFSGVNVDDKAEITASIVGDSAAIGEGAILESTIVGDGVQVPPHAKLVHARVGA